MHSIPQAQTQTDLSTMKYLLAFLLIFFSIQVNAALVVLSGLSTNDDGSTNKITDSVNNREWLRWNVLAGLTYAETLEVLDTQDGSGWTIANNADAQKLIDAISTNECLG